MGLCHRRAISYVIMVKKNVHKDIKCKTHLAFCCNNITTTEMLKE